MLFASAFGDQMFLGFCMFCFLLWFTMRKVKEKVKEIDSKGVIQDAAKNKLLGTITRWLK